MAPNNNPIFSRVADVQWTGLMTAANTTSDLTAGTSYLAFSADATEGGFLQKLRFRAIPAASTAATVARLWLNNGSATGTAANNSLFDEVSLPATTVSATLATAGFEVPVNIPLPAGYRVYITLGTAPGGSSGWMCTAIGGKY